MKLTSLLLTSALLLPLVQTVSAQESSYFKVKESQDLSPRKREKKKKQEGFSGFVVPVLSLGLGGQAIEVGGITKPFSAFAYSFARAGAYFSSAGYSVFFEVKGPDHQSEFEEREIQRQGWDRGFGGEFVLEGETFKNKDGTKENKGYSRVNVGPTFVYTDPNSNYEIILSPNLEYMQIDGSTDNIDFDYTSNGINAQLIAAMRRAVVTIKHHQGLSDTPESMTEFTANLNFIKQLGVSAKYELWHDQVRNWIDSDAVNSILNRNHGELMFVYRP